MDDPIEQKNVKMNGGSEKKFGLPAAAEIAEAHGFEPAVIVPPPATHERIGETREEDSVNEIAGQIEPLRHGARHHGARRIGENQLIKGQRKPFEPILFLKMAPTFWERFFNFTFPGRGKKGPSCSSRPPSCPRPTQWRNQKAFHKKSKSKLVFFFQI